MDSESEETGQSPRKWVGIKRPQIFGNQWISIALFIIGVALVYFFISGFLVRTYLVDGQSMESTLQDGDRLIINKVPRTLARITGQAYIPHRGDVIIFVQPDLVISSGAKKQLIKRVVGLPGERVVVKNGILSIFNQTAPGGFEPDKINLYRIDSPITAGDVDTWLSADEIFVCGDNRSNSEDSRYFGPLKTEEIVGKLAVRFLPLDKARRF